MARHAVHEREPETLEGIDAQRRDVGLVDEVTTKDASGLNVMARVLALVAAAVPTIVGLLAVADIDWSGNGFDAPAVTVADIRFTPAVAVAVLAAGVIGLIAAATRDRASKLVVGRSTPSPHRDRARQPDRAGGSGRPPGWMAILSGAAWSSPGCSRCGTTVRREVRTSTV